MLSGEAKMEYPDLKCVLRISDHVCVPRVGGWIRLILEEAHCSKYSIYTGAAKIYHYLKKYY